MDHLKMAERSVVVAFAIEPNLPSMFGSQDTVSALSCGYPYKKNGQVVKSGLG
jgi:hypothetical protein